MKSVSGLICWFVICMFTASPGFCEAYQLIYEEGFEKRTIDNIPEDWEFKIDPKTKPQYGFDDAEKRSGSYSYKIDIPAPGGRATFSKINTVKKIRPGQRYEVSLWLKAKDLGYSPNFIAPAFRFNTHPRLRPVPTMDLIFLMKGETGWKNLTLTITAPPDASEMNLDFVLTRGTVWIDDLQIFEVGQ
jgi:hypothetical protein